MDQQKPKNINKIEDDEELRSKLLQDLPEWLQDFKENLVDKNVQPHQYSPSSSHELAMEPRAKVVPGPGKHSIYTHFPKDRNCDICLRTKIAWASRRRRTGTVVPKAGNYGDLITADHKVLSEPRHDHRYAVVVQDLTTLWLYNPTRVKQQLLRKPRRATEVPGADKETKSHSH